MASSAAARPRWIAALCHLPDWAASSTHERLYDGIELWEPRSSPVWQAYERLCEERHAHEGVPVEYGAAFVFEPSYTEHIGDFGDPYDTTSILASLTVIATGTPLGMLSCFVSFDHFKTISWYHDLHNYGGHNEALIVTDAPDIDDGAVAFIRDAWSRLLTTRSWDGRSFRVWNALTHWFYAWTAPYADQKILNLAIVLELLFAPHHQSETSHQIAFNVAHYLGSDSTDRARIYMDVKRLYGVRSKLVHGGRADDEALIKAASELHHMCTGVFRRVLGTEEDVRRFEVEQHRKAMLEEFLFA